jgi:hypothetical protein
MMLRGSAFDIAYRAVTSLSPYNVRHSVVPASTSSSSKSQWVDFSFQEMFSHAARLRGDEALSLGSLRYPELATRRVITVRRVGIARLVMVGYQTGPRTASAAGSVVSLDRNAGKLPRWNKIGMGSARRIGTQADPNASRHVFRRVAFQTSLSETSD